MSSIATILELIFVEKSIVESVAQQILKVNVKFKKKIMKVIETNSK